MNFHLYLKGLGGKNKGKYSNLLNPILFGLNLLDQNGRSCTKSG